MSKPFPQIRVPEPTERKSDFSSQRNINKGSSADEPHTDIKDKRSYANGKILSAVRPEPVGVEEHNKCIDKKTQLILKAVAVL